MDEVHYLYMGGRVCDMEASRDAGMRAAVTGWGYLHGDENPASYPLRYRAGPHHWLHYELS